MFIAEPGPSAKRQAFYDDDISDRGYVMNLSRAWAWIPEINDDLFALLDQAARTGDLSFRDKGILITAMASEMGDSYCTLFWGARLAEATDPETAAAVIVEQPTDAMTSRDLALASWARKLAAAPSATTPGDVEGLRQAGLSEQQIMAVTAYVALRIAFSTVNDAIGAPPDREGAEAAPPQVVSAITFGRPVDQSPSTGR